MIANTYVVKPFGISEVKVIALKGEPGGPTQEQVNTAVEEYMDDHPEAQIPDGAVTTEKLASNTVAPYADNLVSSSYVSDSEPYLFRKTFAGVREDTELVGGSVVWNQIFLARWTTSANGITFTRDATNQGMITLTGTATGSAYSRCDPMGLTVAGHVYFTDKGTENSNIWAYNDNNGVGSTTTRYAVGKASEEKYFYIRVTSGATVDETITPMVIDLTLMFGPTIADYIYAQEQATAGAGVALAKKWAGIKGYIPYDAGSLKSVSNVSAHKMVGKNLATELEIGTFSESSPAGTPFANMALSNNARMRSKTLIPTFNRRVTLSWDFSKYQVYVASFDENGNYLGVSSFVAWMSSVYVMNDTARQYIAVALKRNDGANMTASDLTDCKLQVEFGIIATSYVPHQEWSYPLDSSLTLRGIPKLDANNNLYYDGDIYPPSGEVKRRYRLSDLGTLNWTYADSSGRSVFSANVPGLLPEPNVATAINAMCPKYRAVPRNATWVDKDLSYAQSNASRISIVDNSYTDATTFKSAMSGVYLLYPLAEPTTEQAEPYTNPQVCYPDGTEEYIDTRDVPIPVGHNTKYMRDLKKLLEGIPDAPTANGTYVLKATVSASGVTYAWIAG